MLLSKCRGIRRRKSIQVSTSQELTVAGLANPFHIPKNNVQETELISRKADACVEPNFEVFPPKSSSLLETLDSIQTSETNDDNDDELEALCVAVMSRKNTEQQIKSTIPSKENIALIRLVDGIVCTEPAPNELNLMKKRIKTVLLNGRTDPNNDITPELHSVISNISQDSNNAFTIGYSTAINISISLRLDHTISSLVTRMQQSNIKLPREDYIRLLSFYNRRGYVSQTLTIFKEVSKYYYPDGEIVSNVLHAFNTQSPKGSLSKPLYGYSRSESLKFFITLWKAGFYPDMKTFSTLVAGAGNLEVGINVAKIAVFVTKLTPTEDLYKSLLRLCALENRLASAKIIVNCALKCDMAKTEAFWIQVLRTHTQAPEELIDVFGAVKKLLPHPPSETCYIIVLRSMARYTSFPGDIFALHAESLYQEAFSTCLRPPLQLHTELAEVYRRSKDFKAFDSLRSTVVASYNRGGDKSRKWPPGFLSKARMIDRQRQSADKT